MTAFRTLDDIGDVRGKKILVRVDLNVPMEAGRVSDDTRLRVVLPTIRELADAGARVILLAHFGRPKGRPDPEQSLRPVTAALADLLGRPVAFAADCVGPEAESAIAGLPDGGVLLLENTRFHSGEEKNDPEFTRALASLGEIYVNDAFSAAHRAHASTEGLAHHLPAYAGRSMQAELEALRRALGDQMHPVVAVIGGAKVSTKIDLLENLVRKVDALVIGGGMANTFLAAEGKPIGKSLHEPDLLDKARQIRAAADAAGCAIVLPVDAVVAAEFKPNAPSRTVPVAEVGDDDMILDIGRITIEIAKDRISEAKTLVWNGPVGAFEVPPFERATVALAKCAGERTRDHGLLSVAGGGDTVAALNQAGVTEEFSYVSTAGGAFLEWLEGKTLPGVEALSAGRSTT